MKFQYDLHLHTGRTRCDEGTMERQPTDECWWSKHSSLLQSGQWIGLVDSSQEKGGVGFFDVPFTDDFRTPTHLPCEHMDMLASVLATFDSGEGPDEVVVAVQFGRMTASCDSQMADLRGDCPETFSEPLIARIPSKQFAHEG